MQLFTRLSLTVLLLLSVANLTAQVKFQGVVRDTVGKPIEMASIVLIKKVSEEVVSYGITSEDGKFSIKAEPNTAFEAQISAFGLRTITEFIDFKDQDIFKEYVMTNNIVLDEVVVKLPVTVSGDTISYDADSFKNGSERKLEDIIDNLPGVEINDNNQIEVEGKVVNKLLVNGKEFFEGDTKIGTKNIPSNVVDKIQVLRNYSEVSQLNSVRSSQDNIAINIQLKKGKESFVFGNVTAGGGNSPSEDLYVVQPKIFYYNPKYSINWISDLNNIGEIALTRRDIQGLTGRFQAGNTKSGTQINLGNNNLNFNTNQNNALYIENKLSSINFSYSPKPNLDLSGFAIYNYNRANSRQDRLIQYTDSSLNVPDEETQEIGEERSRQLVTKFGASFKPNVNHQLDYDFFARVSDDAQLIGTYSSVVGNTKENETITPISFNQNLNYYLTLSENDILSLEIEHVIREENPYYNALLENNELGVFQSTATALGFNLDQSIFDIGQNREIISNQFDGKIDYYHIISSKANLNVTLGAIRSKQTFDSEIFQILDNGNTNSLTSETSVFATVNNTESDFTDYYAGMYYRLRLGKFTFNPGFSVHQYENLNVQLSNIKFSESFTRFLPDFETRFQIKKSESLTFNYRVFNQFTDVSRLARSLIMNNYNSFQYGEPTLTNGVTRTLSLLYQSFNLFNNTNVFFRGAYSKNIDPIRSLTNFENVIRTNTFFNSGFADENANFSGRIQKTVGKLRFSTNASLNYNKLNQFIQGRQSVNEGISKTIGPGLNTNFRYAPNIRLGYRYSVTDNNQGNRKTQFIRNSVTASFDAYIKKSITLEIDYSYNDQSNEQDKFTFQTLNASLKYRRDKDSKWEYELRGSNLLNIDAQIQNTANNISVFSSQTFIQPRLLTARVIYSL